MKIRNIKITYKLSWKALSLYIHTKLSANALMLFFESFFDQILYYIIHMRYVDNLYPYRWTRARTLDIRNKEKKCSFLWNLFLVKIDEFFISYKFYPIYSYVWSNIFLLQNLVYYTRTLSVERVYLYMCVCLYPAIREDFYSHYKNLYTNS